MPAASGQPVTHGVPGHNCPCAVTSNSARSAPKSPNVALPFSLRQQYLPSAQCERAGGSSRQPCIISVPESYAFSISKT